MQNNTRQFLNQAWTRDAKYDTVHHGEALILACLLHTHSDDRAGMDFEVIQSLMNDINYEED